MKIKFKTTTKILGILIFLEILATSIDILNSYWMFNFNPSQWKIFFWGLFSFFLLTMIFYLAAMIKWLRPINHFLSALEKKEKISSHLVQKAGKEAFNLPLKVALAAVLIWPIRHIGTTLLLLFTIPIDIRPVLGILVFTLCPGLSMAVLCLNLVRALISPTSRLISEKAERMKIIIEAKRLNLKPRILSSSVLFCGAVTIYISLFAYFNHIKVAAGQVINEGMLLFWLFIFFIWAIIIICVIFYFLAQTISQPIKWLLSATKKISDGDLTARAPEVSRDEVGDLVISFNEMAKSIEEAKTGLEQKIQERTRELEGARAGLEVKVEARTKELRELTENLDEQVKEKTQKLQGKVEELEKFNKLAVGREFKMIGLKEEIKKLKEELEKSTPST